MSVCSSHSRCSGRLWFAAGDPDSSFRLGWLENRKNYGCFLSYTTNSSSTHRVKFIEDLPIVINFLPLLLLLLKGGCFSTGRRRRFSRGSSSFSTQFSLEHMRWWSMQLSHMGSHNNLDHLLPLSLQNNGAIVHLSCWWCFTTLRLRLLRVCKWGKNLNRWRTEGEKRGREGEVGNEQIGPVSRLSPPSLSLFFWTIVWIGSFGERDEKGVKKWRSKNNTVRSMTGRRRGACVYVWIRSTAAAHWEFLPFLIQFPRSNFFFQSCFHWPLLL